MKKYGKFYATMVERLNDAGIDFGLNQFYAVYLINPDAKLGKKFKPLLLKMVNYICDFAENNKSYRAEQLDMRSSLNYFDDWTEFSVYIQNEEGDEIFSFTAVKDDEHPGHWDMFKIFLQQFNGWLYANQEK